MSLASFFGTPNAVPVPQYNLAQTQGLTDFLGNIGNVQGWGSLGWNSLPQAQETFNQGYGNPFAGQAVAGAQGASNLGGAIGANTFGSGQNFLDAAQGMIPYAFNVMNTGFDPQNALYNRTAQQVQDQARVSLAQRGVGTTPYGAGIENDAMRNFNIDWQNNQLGRQTQALGAGAGALTQGANVAGQGIGWQQGLPQWMTNTGMLPYATWNAINQGQWGNLQNLLNYGQVGQALSQQPIADYLGLYGAGNQQYASDINKYKAQTQAQQASFEDYAKIGQAVGSFGSSIPFSKMTVDPFPK